MVKFIGRTLDVLWWLGSFACGVLTLLLLWSLATKMPVPGGFALEIGPASFSFHPPYADPSRNLTILLPVAMEATGPDPVMTQVRGSYRFSVQKGAFLSVSIGLLDIFIVLGLRIVDQLRKVFRGLENKDPFQTENSRRIRRIGWTVILLEVLRAVATAYWSGSATLDGWRAASHLGAPGVLFGLLILVLAEVFREGARLREEQSLTI